MCSKSEEIDGEFWEFSDVVRGATRLWIVEARCSRFFELFSVLSVLFSLFLLLIDMEQEEEEGRQLLSVVDSDDNNRVRAISSSERTEGNRKASASPPLEFKEPRLRAAASA